MLRRTGERILAAADLLRPRTVLRTLARVDMLADATRQLTESVEALRLQTEQLIAIQRIDADRGDETARLDRELDPARIDAHVTTAVEHARLERDPFPYIVVADWLPRDVYRRMIDAIPPPVFFAHRDKAKQRLRVPFGFAPEYCRSVWKFIAEWVVNDVLNRALNAKFQPVVRDYVHSFCPVLPDGLDLTLNPSSGRIMLRRPGYTLAPHRDPKWGFMTALAYLARPGDSEVFGTQLYRVRNDQEARDGMVHYVPQAECELVTTVPFRANTLLVFLNSSGAHGASIPATAPPETERYLYQFRLGPTAPVIKRLLDAMPPDRAALWAGDRATRAVASY